VEFRSISIGNYLAKVDAFSETFAWLVGLSESLKFVFDLQSVEVALGWTISVLDRQRAVRETVPMASEPRKSR
jgi:hypothetical protein